MDEELAAARLPPSSIRGTSLRIALSLAIAGSMLAADIATGAKGMAGVLYVPLLVAIATKARTREVVWFGLLGSVFAIAAYLIARVHAPDRVAAWPLGIGLASILVASLLLSRLVASREALIVTNRALEYSEWRYRSIFEQTRLAFFERDFSGAYEIYDELRAAGVTDLVEHGRREPGLAARLARSVRALAFNDAMMRLVGATSREEFPPTLADMMPEPVSMLRLQQALFDGRTRMDGRSTLTTIRGEIRDVWVTAELSQDPSRRGVMVGLLFDLTESEQSARAMAAARAELARASRVATVGAISVSIAHELNQPLAAAMMNAQTGLRYLSRENPDVAAASAAIVRAVDEGQRAATIVRRTREAATACPATAEQVDVAALVREVLALLDHGIEDAAVRVDLALPDEPVLIVGDRTAFQQVLVNLVTNAIQAMEDRPRDERRLAVTLHVARERAVIEVCDTGHGIAAEHLETLFDPFFTTKEHGVGVGLAISRSAVEAMGGTLTAANVAGGGAVFACAIPVSAREA